MKRIQLIGVVLAVLCGAQGADAQKRWFTLGYGVSIPSGSTTDFTPHASWASVVVEARQRVARHLSLGVWWSFNEISDEVDEILDLRQLGFPDSEAVAGNLSGNQFRTINTMPFLLTAHYYPTAPTGSIVPYLGLGAGVTFNERRLDIGLVQFKDEDWALAVAPEVGLVWWTSEWVGFGVDGRYSLSWADRFDVRYWNVNLVVAWRL